MHTILEKTFIFGGMKNPFYNLIRESTISRLIFGLMRGLFIKATGFCRAQIRPLAMSGFRRGAEWARSEWRPTHRLMRFYKKGG
ncbi:MAG: hypothetical protein ABJZ91_15885, partial [Cyclobacteriaceae bacterium]